MLLQRLPFFEVQVKRPLTLHCVGPREIRTSKSSGVPFGECSLVRIRSREFVAYRR